jgi:predicted amidophosphoribosyltransferase
LLHRHLPPVTQAARFSRVLKAPWSPHILAKVRRTRPQTELNASERRNNLRGAFRLIGRPQLEGTRVLLVDDVLTTGTTAHRAAAVLKKAGATVFVAVIARGLGPGTHPVASVQATAPATSQA